MNYLAHAALSFRNPPVLVGNLISDFVKGGRQYQYDAAIQQGIRLHRAIDTFTDDHYGVREAKQVFRSHYRLYAGAFVDVSFDHFVANDPGMFANGEDLAAFAQFTYQCLGEYRHQLPDACIGYFDRMKQQNWLYNYRYAWGIHKSFHGIVYRARYLEEADLASGLFDRHRDTLQACYRAFIPDLLQLVNEEADRLGIARGDDPF